MSAPSGFPPLDALRARFETEPSSVAFVFFPDCGSATEPPTRSCLSQWGTAPFESEGRRFLSSEQALMHAKALLFGDAEMAARILAARTSWMARELGGRVRGFREDAWAERRHGLAVAANLPRFAQNPSLRDFLLSTEDAVLAESSPVDRVWGIGLDESDRHARDPRRWPGLNLLGFALMEVREALRNQGHRGN